MLVRPVAFVGMPGVGKSTVARMVGRHLAVNVIDLDAEIERTEERSIAEIFAASGEGAFRDHETSALRAALKANPVAIISCGGGIVSRSENRALLRDSSCCVWMTVSHAALAARVQASHTQRPLLLGDVDGQLVRLAAEREPWFVETAEIIIDASIGTAWEVTDAVVAELASAVPPVLDGVAQANVASADVEGDTQ